MQTFYKGGKAGINMLTVDEGGIIATLNKEGQVGTIMKTDSMTRGVYSLYENGSPATFMATFFGVAMLGTYYGNEYDK